MRAATGVRRVVANNPGLMTYHGTNTYLLDHDDGVAVVDPGPEDPAHAEAVLRAAGGRVSAILLTHYHPDHAGAVGLLRADRPVPVHGFRPAAEGAVTPDRVLEEGDLVLGMRVLHTPGHAADHICFARSDRILFSGDHVMSWSSSVVSPPNGDMALYCRSLDRLLARDDLLFLPGHGPPLSDPAAYVEELLRHRVARENEILDLLRAAAAEPEQIVRALYAKRDPRLFRAAERNVVAHLDKLEKEGAVRRTAEGWRTA